MEHYAVPEYLLPIRNTSTFLQLNIWIKINMFICEGWVVGRRIHWWGCSPDQTKCPVETAWEYSITEVGKKESSDEDRGDRVRIQIEVRLRFFNLLRKQGSGSLIKLKRSKAKCSPQSIRFFSVISLSISAGLGSRSRVFLSAWSRLKKKNKKPELQKYAAPVPEDKKHMEIVHFLLFCG